MAKLNFSDSFFNLDDENDIDELSSDRKHKKRILATLDFETDPFEYGRKPEPFQVGLYIDGGDYFMFWGDDCLTQLVDFLKDYPDPLRIYAHNGGKFDFVYLLRMGLLSHDVNVISGRIVVAKLLHHELRDSYAIIPVPLSAAGDKLDIEYWKMEREHREKHKDEISTYLKQDCVELFYLVKAFIDRFGVKLTIGGTALKILRKMHPFESREETEDSELRKYYFGGRVEFFESGVIEGSHKVYDVNSMYPYVMHSSEHFTGAYYKEPDPLSVFNMKTGAVNGDKNLPYFMTFKGKNNNALPTRQKDGLDFSVKEGIFHATSHEIKVALKYGLIEIEEIHDLLIPMSSINFKDYVDEFIAEKIDAKKRGDKIAELFAKLLLNSAYGKTAQNPDNYYDWVLVDSEDAEDYDFLGYEIYCDFEDFFLMRRPSEEKVFYDVGIGASITGAARAVLLEAIVNAKRPLYCDTDSIICEALEGVKLDDYELGAWDLEGEGDTLAIYGKKVYSLFKGETGVKKACKGVNLSHAEIYKLASGESVSYASAAPSFKLSGETEFTSRILGAEKHSKIFDKFGDKISAENN